MDSCEIEEIKHSLKKVFVKCFNNHHFQVTESVLMLLSNKTIFEKLTSNFKIRKYLLPEIVSFLKNKSQCNWFEYFFSIILED